MMNKLVTTILACLLAATSFAEDINRSVDASSSGHVEVSNIAGSVTISGWNRNTVEVTGSLGKNVEELIVERDGDKVLVKVKVHKKRGRAIGIDSELHINVPENSSINVGTVSANIDATDVAGEQSLHSVSGNVDTEFVGADIMAESVSGDVEISGNKAEGEVSASSVSGDVTLFRVSGDVNAESVSGGIVVDEGVFSRGNFETVTGEIIVQGGLQNGGKVTMDSVNGDVTAKFSGDLSASISIESFNGKIRNCSGPEAERTSKYGPGLELEYDIGGGDGRVTIATLNGDVSFCSK